jgi:hypothetical protein
MRCQPAGVSTDCQIGLGKSFLHSKNDSCIPDSWCPSIVIVDKGKAKTLTTTTAQSDVYAFIFGQHGLMAGVDVQGSKITKIDR